MMGSMGWHLNPITGNHASPNMGSLIWHRLRMEPQTPREVLAANVNALIERTNDPGAHRRLVAHGIPNGTLGRIRNAQVATSVDQLQKLGAGLGVPSWLLLVPPHQRDAILSLWNAVNSLAGDQPMTAADEKRKQLRSA